MICTTSQSRSSGSQLVSETTHITSSFVATAKSNYQLKDFMAFRGADLSLSVCIGRGLDPTTQQATNKVWVSDDGSKWEPSLPSLPIACEKPLVVNTGSPEYLIVIGGQIVEDVNVMIGEQWLAAEPMPLNSSYVRRFAVNSIHTDFSAHMIHNRNMLVLSSIHIFRSFSHCRLWILE